MDNQQPASAATGPQGVLLALSGDDAAILRALDAPGSGLKVVRRCADAAELLSAAMAGLATLAVVDTAFDELDRTILDRLLRAGVLGVLLTPDAERERWTATGWPLESVASPPAAVRTRLQAIARGLEEPRRPSASVPTASGSAPRAGSTDLWAEFEAAAAPGPPPLPAAAGTADTAGSEGRPRGGLLVVWGPQGAPGRSTVAAALAAGLSGSTILVDADIQAPCLTQLLGLPEDSSALATAARLASRGRLDTESLDRILIPISADRRLLTGLGRPGRWRELPPAAMPEVWEQCRRAAAWTVVDVAGGPVDDAVDDFTLEPGRGAMTADLLRNADVAVIVGAGDPIGVRRLLQLMDDPEGQMRPAGRVEVVVNRVRASAAGPSPQRAVREALARFGGVEEVTVLPEDAATADRCLMEGRSVLEAAPASPLGRALADLVDRIDPRSEAAARAGRAARGARLRRLTTLLGSDRQRPPSARKAAAPKATGASPTAPLSTAEAAAPAPPPPPPPPPDAAAATSTSARNRGGRHRA
ncbi:MAG: hypothetical protein E7Z94_00870 [Actinomyces ruminicola]|nr:hypothetical protein [Actinomyces ruminicola]